MASRTHAQRLARWCHFGGPGLRLLVDQVEASLVPFWISAGFVRCETNPFHPEPVRANEIMLARTMGDHIICVSIGFDKYHRPEFGVSFLRSNVSQPHHQTLIGHLVSRPTRYFQSWGKPWWWPGRLWRASMTRREVARVVALQAQALAFLETGVRNRAISKDLRS
jgi:hypothetical protein